MELSPEIIEQAGLSPEQVTAVSAYGETHIQKINEDWAGKANKDAEAILDGAALSVSKLTGVERAKGQKIADYISAASSTYFETKTTALEQKAIELEDKIKNSGKNETVVKELENTKEQLRVLKEKEATFADYEENDYKGKWEKSSQELSSLKVNSAFRDVKPSKPDNVNTYEFDHKWSTLKSSILEKNDILEIDGEVYAVNKENELIKTKLSEVISKDKDLSALISGKPTGFKVDTKGVKIDGVPFEVPENADAKVRTKLIREYLAKQGIQQTSKSYPAMFAELNQKITSPKTA